MGSKDPEPFETQSSVIYLNNYKKRIKIMLDVGLSF